MPELHHHHHHHIPRRQTVVSSAVLPYAAPTMNRYLAPTPCPAPMPLGVLGRPAAYAHDTTTTTTTTTVEYSADLAHDLRHVRPRRRPAAHRKPPAWDPATDIWADDGTTAPPQQVEPAAARTQSHRQSAMFAQPAQRIPLPPAPVKEDETLRPRRRRVSALLAEKRLGTTLHDAAAAPEKKKKSELQKDPRRRTIYVPSDDTTIMTIHPGALAHARRPRSPDLGFDLVTLSEEEPEQLAPAIKHKTAPRKSLAAAPKRAPLQQNARPLQAVSFVEDVVGKTLGKENIPPGMSLKPNTKPLRPAAAAPHAAQTRAKASGKPEPVRKDAGRATAPTSASAAKTATARKRTGSESVHKESPSKSLKSARNASVARPPLQDATTRRRTRASASNPSSPFNVVKSPPQALRRRRVEKAPSRLGAPKLSQKLHQQEKYPVLSEDLDKPDLYEDSWLSYQEVAITQLVNKLFDSADLSSQDEDQEGGSLRRKLLAVYQEQPIPLLYKRLQASLRYGALSIPKDLLAKALRLKDDVGLRRKFLNLFVNTYDLSLLRAAAEAIVGRECPLSSRLSSGSASSDTEQRQRRAEKRTIEGFIDAFFIRNEDAVRVKTGIGSIVNIARGRDNKADDFGSQGWSWRRTVLRSLMLILLLDMSKSKEIFNSPLFQTTSPHKSSNAVLQQLASILLPSLGDLSRPLGHLDYHLQCVQYPLQEYKYRVENLATDLRDGVQLARLVELLLYKPTALAFQRDVTIAMPAGDILTSCFSVDEKDSWVLSQHLRFPCLCRAQKLYNIQISLSALEGVRGVAGQAVRGVTAEDIVDGHRERTLGLLWGIVGKWGLQALVDWSEVEKETKRYTALYYERLSEDYQDPDSEDESELAELQGLEKHTALLRGWARSIARLQGLRVANLTTSFSDGRVLEALVDEYISCFPASAALQPSSASLPTKLRSVGCSEPFISLFAPSTTRPIPSKDFTVTSLTFLASRLLPASRAHRAALAIQRCYRARLARREVSRRLALMRIAAHCATVVQTRERVVGAAVVLQRAWRRVLDTRIGKLVGDVTSFQALARGWALRNKMAKNSRGRKTERVRGGW